MGLPPDAVSPTVVVLVPWSFHARGEAAAFCWLDWSLYARSDLLLVFFFPVCVNADFALTSGKDLVLFISVKLDKNSCLV